MMKKIIISLVFCFILAEAHSLYFMPQDAKSAVSALIQEIKSAKSEVKIAIYNFTNKEIAKAVRDSAKKGVRFHIIFDKKQAKDNRSQIGYLAKLKNVEVCTLEGKHNGKYSGIMHNKIAVIDGESVVFGSANWSKSAFEVNYEMMIITQDRDIISKIEGYLDMMIKQCEQF